MCICVRLFVTRAVGGSEGSREGDGGGYQGSKVSRTGAYLLQEALNVIRWVSPICACLLYNPAPRVTEQSAEKHRLFIKLGFWFFYRNV